MGPGCPGRRLNRRWHPGKCLFKNEGHGGQLHPWVRVEVVPWNMGLILGLISGKNLSPPGARDRSAPVSGQGSCNWARWTALSFHPAYLLCIMGNRVSLSPHPHKALGGRDCYYPSFVDEETEGQSGPVTCSGTWNDPSLPTPVSTLAVGGSPCSAEHLPGLLGWSCSRRARGRGRAPGQACVVLLAPALPGRPRERWRSIINKGVGFPISALCILLAQRFTV